MRGTYIFFFVYRHAIKTFCRAKSRKAYSYCNYMRCANLWKLNTLFAWSHAVCRLNWQNWRKSPQLMLSKIFGVEGTLKESFYLLKRMQGTHMLHSGHNRHFFWSPACNKKCSASEKRKKTFSYCNSMRVLSCVAREVQLDNMLLPKSVPQSLLKVKVPPYWNAQQRFSACRRFASSVNNHYYLNAL